MTLVGFSLGARVVFKCLQALTETEKNGISQRSHAYLCFFTSPVMTHFSRQLRLWKELFFLEPQFQSITRTGET